MPVGRGGGVLDDALLGTREEFGVGDGSTKSQSRSSTSQSCFPKRHTLSHQRDEGEAEEDAYEAALMAEDPFAANREKRSTCRGLRAAGHRQHPPVYVPLDIVNNQSAGLRAAGHRHYVP